MPKARYALEKGKDQRVEVSWKGMFKNISIKLDGEEVASYANKSEIATEQTITLPDESILTIKHDRKTGINLTRNGQPLPGSANDPEALVNTAGAILYFLGALNIVIGLIAELGNVSFLLMLGVGYFSAAFGAILLILGYFTKSRSLAALILAIVLLVVDMALGLYVQMELLGPGETPRTSGIIIKVLFIIPLWKAISPMRMLNKQDASSQGVIDQ